MLTRNPATLVRRAGGNPYEPGAANSYSEGGNPFVQDSSPGTPAMPEHPQVNTVDDQMDSAQQEAEKLATIGWYHGVTGSRPESSDLLYRVGYDEGRIDRTGASNKLTWNVPDGRISTFWAVSPEGYEAYIVNATGDDEGRPVKFMWWVEGLTGKEMGYGYAQSFFDASDAVHALLDQYPKFAKVLGDLLDSNPDLDPRRAVRVAKQAMRISEVG